MNKTLVVLDCETCSFKGSLNRISTRALSSLEELPSLSEKDFLAETETAPPNATIRPAMTVDVFLKQYPISELCKKLGGYGLDSLLSEVDPATLGEHYSNTQFFTDSKRAFDTYRRLHLVVGKPKATAERTQEELIHKKFFGLYFPTA